MPQIFLKGFWAADSNATIDLTDGATIAPSESPLDRSPVAHGLFHRIDPDTVSAIFAANDCLHQQINNQRWEIEKDRISIRTYDSLLGTSWRTVVVYSLWKRAFRSKYCYFGEGGLTTIIPLDAIDEETEDWWLFLSRSYPNQTAWMKCKAHLSKGIPCW